MRLSALAEHLHIAARSATEVVDALEDRRLVERQDDPSDRRAVLITLTKEGTELLRALRATRETEGDRLFEALSESERATLLRILRKLQD